MKAYFCQGFTHCTLGYVLIIWTCTESWNIIQQLIVYTSMGFVYTSMGFGYTSMGFVHTSMGFVYTSMGFVLKYSVSIYYDQKCASKSAPKLSYQRISYIYQLSYKYELQ